jgi:hypothetical protein
VREFNLVLPPFTVTWPKVSSPTVVTTGDVLLVHHNDAASALIDEGQRILALTEPSLHPYIWATHSAYARSADTLSEMAFSGYRQVPVSSYDHFIRAVVHFDLTDEQRATTLRNDDAMNGVSYGWTQYIPLMIDGISGARFEGSWGSSVICSTHVTLVMMGAGLFPDCPPSLVVPARIASWVTASP